jgi:gamma-glutamyltranspeptidase/glutathione hydrolase
MGHRIVVERPWGALEAIHSPRGEGGMRPLAAFADDTTRGNYLAPGRLYGANDERRPAGAAVGR